MCIRDRLYWIIHAEQDRAEITMESSVFSLEEIIISEHNDNLKLIADIDLKVTPVNSSQEILRKVPGLFIGQHAGGGKAEQIFLRGFDIDHGTDIAINVDGMPVNMVSHAHGQGYADLHFLIPETIDKIDFGKGPYHADQGNFATAAYVNFKTKDQLDQNAIKLELGQFNTQRIYGQYKILDAEKHKLYLASEFLNSDGPFESPQDLKRFNGLAKYTGQLTPADRIKFTISHFESSWSASGQIPVRAVEDGSISRFGAIDDTEGGATSRTNVNFNYNKILDDNSSLNNQIFFTHYDFELFSNFTFFLNDPLNGDQIKQKESRKLFGLNSEYNRLLNLNGIEALLKFGMGFRSDLVDDNELSNTLNKTEIIDRAQFGDVREHNFKSHLGLQFDFGRLSVQPALRFDVFNFGYENQLLSDLTLPTIKEGILSPKLNLFYDQSEELQLYAKFGKGFHTNDSRLVLEQSQSENIPSAFGIDLGYIWKPNPMIFLNMAFWHLFLEQEFVYVGDEGIVEPSDRTRRRGIDLSLRTQPLKKLFWNFDLSFAEARSLDQEIGNDFIPLAPQLSLMSSLNYQLSKNFQASLNLRHLDDRPANEDNSIIAEGYSVLDLNLDYQWKRLSIGIAIQNLLNTEWNETQFATLSRLQSELEAREEIHFTPGTPFFFKSIIQYKF